MARSLGVLWLWAVDFGRDGFSAGSIDGPSYARLRSQIERSSHNQHPLTKCRKRASVPWTEATGQNRSNLVLVVANRVGGWALALSPVAPMCRTEVDPFFGSRIKPTVECTAAREFQSVDFAVWIDHGKFKVALEGSSNDRLPIDDDLRQMLACCSGAAPEPLQILCNRNISCRR